MHLRPVIDNQELTEFFLNDEELCALGLSDLELDVLHKEKCYNIPKNAIPWCIADEQDKVVIYARCELVTEHCLNVHVYTSSKYRHDGNTIGEAWRTFLGFLHQETQLMKIIAMAPDNCPHVKIAVEKLGFKQEGCLTKAIEWRGELVDLYLYGYNINRE